MGTEPKSINSNTEYLYALNWYNYFHDVKSGKKWVEEYAKKNGLSLRNTKEINMTMCAIARMHNQGLNIPPKSVKWLNSKIKNKVKPQKAEVIKIASKRFPLYKFEDLLDSFYNGNYEYFEPKAYDLLRSVEAKPIDAKSVVNYYTPLLEELQEGGEGYEHLKKKQLKNYVNFISKIIEEASTFAGNAKTVRVKKPRKKKEITAAKLVKYVKYQERYDELQIVSVPPEKIIGAKTVWLYNTKYKKLTKVVGDSLTIKGTTIQANNPELTVCKTLRKPNEQIADFMQGTEARKRKFFSGLKTKESQTNARLNANTVILKVY